MRAGRSGLLALLAVLLLALAGCGVPNDDSPRALDPTAVPFQVTTRSATPAAPGNSDVGIYLVRNDRLERVLRPLEPPITPERVLEQLLDPLTEEEIDAGLSSAIPGSVELDDFTIESGVAVVTLIGLQDRQVRSDQPTAFAQIVTTLDELPGVDGVRFRRDGADLEVPRGDSSFADGPLTRADYTELLMPVMPEPSPSPSPLPSPSPSPFPVPAPG